MNPTPPNTLPATRADDLAAVIRDGILFQSKALPSVDDESLLAVVHDFLATLNSSRIPHVLIGDLALLQHVEGRNTRDIDLIVATDDLARLPELEIEEQNEWFATGNFGPLRVDLLFTANPLFALVADEHAEMRDFAGGRMRCATPFGIALLKLFALPSLYRQAQFDRAALYETDLLLLLRHYEMEDAALLGVLQDHMPASDLNALAGVLADVRARIRRSEEFPPDAH